MDVSHLRVFGRKAYILIPKDNRKKRDPKSGVCTFLGPDDPNFASWMTLRRDLLFLKQQIFLKPQKTCQQIFRQTHYHLRSRNTLRIPQKIRKVQEPLRIIWTSENISESPRRSGRIRRKPTWLKYEHAESDEDTASGTVIMIANEIATQSFKEAFPEPEFEIWKNAMEKEMKFLQNKKPGS